MFGLSFLKLAIQALAFSTMILAYGLRVSAWVGVVVFLITSLGTVAPSTPVAMGAFELLCVAGLGLFGVGKPAAVGFALSAFVVLEAPVWLVGFFCLAHSGASLRQIRNKVGYGQRRAESG